MCLAISVLFLEVRCFFAFLIWSAVTSLGLAGILYQDVLFPVFYLLVRTILGCLPFILLFPQRPPERYGWCFIILLFIGSSWFVASTPFLGPDPPGTRVVFRAVCVGLDTLILITEAILGCLFSSTKNC